MLKFKVDCRVLGCCLYAAVLCLPVFSSDAGAPRPPLNPEMRGDIFMARKMYRDAIDMYRECVPGSAVDNKIGIAFQQMSQLPLAKKYYEEAIGMNASYAEAINNLGSLYFAGRSYRKAILYFKRSLKMSGPVASVYANLGAAYFARRNYKEASGYYEQAIKLDPDVLERRDSFGIRLLDNTQTDLATFHLYLAKTYAKAGADERAIGYLRKAMEEGLQNRRKLADMPEFSELRTKPAFLDLLAQNPKPL